jgi:hypothetical protein
MLGVYLNRDLALAGSVDQEPVFSEAMPSQ